MASLSRRTFIATTGTALAGAMIANPFGTSSLHAMVADKKKRIANA